MVIPHIFYLIHVLGGEDLVIYLLLYKKKKTHFSRSLNV